MDSDEEAEREVGPCILITNMIMYVCRWHWQVVWQLLRTTDESCSILATLYCLMPHSSMEMDSSGEMRCKAFFPACILYSSRKSEQRERERKFCRRETLQLVSQPWHCNRAPLLNVTWKCIERINFSSTSIWLMQKVEREKTFLRFPVRQQQQRRLNLSPLELLIEPLEIPCAISSLYYLNAHM